MQFVKPWVGEMKQCFTCKRVLPKDSFTRNSHKPDGRHPNCKECRNAARRARYAENPEHYREKSRKFRQAHPGYYKELLAKWYEENKPRAFKLARKWAKNNRGKRCAMRMRRVAGQLQATPKWADAEKIKEFYVIADMMRKLTGEDYHVDHIVPLRGVNVCGLHNEFNLQVLPASENIRKGNKHEV